MIKILVLFCVIVVSFVRGLPKFGPQMDLQIIRTCKKQNPVDMVEFNMAMENKEFKATDEAQFDCFLLCLYEKYKFMTSEGEFNIEHIIGELSIVESIFPVLEQLVHHCTSLPVYDKCERAIEFTKCFWKMSTSMMNSEESQTSTEKFYKFVGVASSDLNMISAAMDDYHEMTCVRFRPRSTMDTDYLSITSSRSGCWSSVGRIGGRQELNLQSPGCLTKKGTVIHELMHAMGFLHEQNRSERDHHVTINWGNIQRNLEGNFKKAKKEDTNAFGVQYDYRSVMHYSGNAFSSNGKPTIVPKINGVELGQREGFSRHDVLKIKKMYKCP